MTENKASDRAKRGLAVFLVFAFAVPWTIWFALRAQAGSAGLSQPLGFLIAPALVSLGGFAAALADGGKQGLVAFARRTMFSRIRIAALALAPALVIVAGLLTFITHPEHLLDQGKPDLWIWLGSLTLMNLWTGPLAEEFGWRGYLQPWLEQRMALLPAALITGLVWALWHWPLFMDSLFSAASAASGYVVWVVAWAVVLAAVTRLARGNVVPAVVLHLCMNTQADMFSAMLPALDGEHLPSGWSLSIASAIVAVLAVMMVRQKS